MNGCFTSLFVSLALLSTVPLTASSADDSYRFMRHEVTYEDTLRTKVIGAENMTMFACAMQVVETAAYHRGLVDGRTSTETECFKTSQEHGKLSITIRVEVCDNPEEWLTTKYYCELTMDEREKEPVE